MAPPVLVLAMHGTRSPAGQAVAAELAAAVAARLPGVPVRLGWADVLSPTLTETLCGLGEAVVVPGFLTAGYHVTSDLPAAVQAAGGRARIAPLIGPGLVAAVADRLLAAGGPGDAVVLAHAGSLRERALGEVRAAAAELSGLVRRPVVPAFLTAAEPSVPAAVAGLRTAGHSTVAVATYLLAPGVFAERLHSVGADVISAPIGVHPLVVDAVITAFAAASGEQLDLPDAPAQDLGRELIA